MIHLPENWDTLTVNEKKNWLVRYAADFMREGEITGIRSQCGDDVKEAWNEVMEAGS